MKDLHIITDLQYGSTGKGLFAGYLAKRIRPDLIVTAWGPNAGHTFIDGDGNKFVNIALPNGLVSDSVKQVLLGPGSIINPDILLSEMERDKHLTENVMLSIHENATVVAERHREEEASYGFEIGSTMKGVGAAVIEKIRRRKGESAQPIVAKDALRGTPLEGFVVDCSTYDSILDKAEVVLLEGAQGFSLSINQGFYPYVTSRECTTHQLLSDCAMPAYQRNAKVYGVARTYPIRVANRYAVCEQCGAGDVMRYCGGCKGTGKVQIGWSGPCYPDQEEITWESLGLQPELTTVTKLPRRIFTFSLQQIKDAVRMNGVDEIFLNFANYVDRETGGPRGAVYKMVNDIERATRAKVRWLGYGAKESDVIDTMENE